MIDVLNCHIVVIGMMPYEVYCKHIFNYNTPLNFTVVWYIKGQLENCLNLPDKSYECETL